MKQQQYLPNLLLDNLKLVVVKFNFSCFLIFVSSYDVKKYNNWHVMYKRSFNFINLLFKTQFVTIVMLFIVKYYN